MNNSKIRNILSIILKPIAYIFPIKKNRIIFKSYDDKYNCSLKYICEYIMQNCNNKFDLIYVTSDKKSEEYLKDKSIKVCKSLTLKYFIYMFTSKFIIVNHNIPQYFPKKKSQILINTWHGGGSYKRLIDNHTTPEEYAKTDKFISSCKSFSKHNLEKDFFIKKEQLFEIGLPRNDLFFTDRPDIIKKVKNELGIPESKKIILYAPTFRASHKKEHLSADFKKIINSCNKKFGGEFVFVNRDHRFSLENNGNEINDDFIYESNIITDTQELIYASDIIITDYSSLMWDASFSGHPCFIYAYDLDDYYKIWDFYTPIEEWPFPVGKTINELVDKIISFDENEYNKNVELHHKALGSFETGTACKKVAEYMINKISR